MQIVVLDTWPVVEYMRGREPCASVVQQLLLSDPEAVSMSAVNFAEVDSALTRLLGPVEASREFTNLRERVTCESVTLEIAETASRVKGTFHMALGDSFAVATALSHAAPLWTGDSELLCQDRIWDSEDLRSPEQIREAERPEARRRKPVGRRATGPLAGLSTDELIEYVTEPLRRSARARELR